MDKRKEKKLIQGLAAGKSQNQVAKEIGISQPAISKYLSRHPEIQEKILQEASRLMDSLPDIIDQLKRDIRQSNELSKLLAGEIKPDEYKGLLMEPKQLIALQKLNYSKQADVLRALGILSSPTQSLIVQQYIQQNQVNVLSKPVQEILSKFVEVNLLGDDEVIDAEVSE